MNIYESWIAKTPIAHRGLFDENIPENSIAAVFEKGYKMGDRVLRFASVQITN